LEGIDRDSSYHTAKADETDGALYTDCPLFPRATGRWANKLRGTLIYFGHLRDDRQGAADLAFWKEREGDPCSRPVTMDYVNAGVGTRRRMQRMGKESP
jgi:hypothetical protein